jgi:hypothetical protein
VKDPRFWIGDFSNRIYMTQAWREMKGHPGVFECTGKRFDVTDAVLAIAKRHADRITADLETGADVPA